MTDWRHVHGMLKGIAARRSALDAEELMIEGNGAGSDTLFQDRMQIAAVNVHVGSAEVLLFSGIEFDFVQRLTSVPGAADITLRFDAGGAQSVFDAEAAQHFGYVGAEDDACTNAREGGRLFVNAHRKTGALQEASGGQAAEAGADNCNPCRSIHD